MVFHEAGGLDFDAFCDMALTLEIRPEMPGFYVWGYDVMVGETKEKAGMQGF